MHTTDLLTVGEVASRSGMAPSALRYYESTGLIEARRTSGNQRRYQRGVLRRLAFIRAAQNVGLSLDEIATAPDAAAQPAQPPASLPFFYILLFIGAMYFALIRPQTQAKKKQEETMKGARTGDKIVTSSGIHGVISNVKRGLAEGKTPVWKVHTGFSCETLDGLIWSRFAYREL